MKFPKNPLDEFGKKLFAQTMKSSRIATFGNCVVVYAPAAEGILSQLFDASEAEHKLGEILKANPDADLTKYEQALGIKILDVQRPTPPAPMKPKKLGLHIALEDEE